jgi:sugar-specific transcriptional regulator TrmB
MIQNLDTKINRKFMDMDIEELHKILEQVGLTKTEVLVYLALVKSGQSTAYKIANEAHLYRANTYMAIENLIAKGFVLKNEVNRRQILKAVSPEEFIKTLDRQKEKLQAAIPLIPRGFSEDVENVSVFTGINAFFSLLYSLLEKKQDIYVFDIPSYVPELLSSHINQFHKERIKRKIKMYHIYDYDSPRIAYLNSLKHTYAKKGMPGRISTTSTLVCGDITQIINWKKGLKVVKIIDKDISEAYKKQFDLLWNYKPNKN